MFHEATFLFCCEEVIVMWGGKCAKQQRPYGTREEVYTRTRRVDSTNIVTYLLKFMLNAHVCVAFLKIIIKIYSCSSKYFFACLFVYLSIHLFYCYCHY